VKKNISQKDQIDNQKVETVTEEFTGKNLTRFGGAGLIRRFFKRQHIQEKIEQGVQIEGRRECKYGVGSMLVSLLYGMFLGYPRPSQMKAGGFREGVGRGVFRVCLHKIFSALFIYFLTTNSYFPQHSIRNFHKKGFGHLLKS